MIQYKLFWLLIRIAQYKNVLYNAGRSARPIDNPSMDYVGRVLIHRDSHYFYRKAFLKILQNSQGNTCAAVSL